MTEHEHMPPIVRDGAQWLCPGKIKITITGDKVVRTWEEAMALVQGITEVLQLEYRQ